MICAAILEDTAEAPLLLSLPILQALETSINLGNQSMDFQAIQDVGTCFFNERGQLCLRLFDLEVLRPIRQVH